MSNLGVRYRRGQASIARLGSKAALACGKSLWVLRIFPEGCIVGIKSSDLTELSCLLRVDMPKVLSVTAHSFSPGGNLLTHEGTRVQIYCGPVRLMAEE